MWAVEGSSKSELIKQTNKTAVKFYVDGIRIKDETLMRKEISIKGEQTVSRPLTGISEPTVWLPTAKHWGSGPGVGAMQE